MIRLLFLLLLILLCGASRAQETAPPNQQPGTRGAAHEKKETVFSIVDKMPEFPGGDRQLFNYLVQETVYPQEAADAGVSGVVMVGFVVDSRGVVRSAHIHHGIGHGCDEEALRVVRNMPHWIPGRLHGRSVAVRCRLPLRFSPEASGLEIIQWERSAMEQPRFPGGEVALDEFLQGQIKYPYTARRAGVKGRVDVSFDIDEHGLIHDIRVEKGIGHGCDEEAVRVVEIMPRWIPGREEGVPVKMRHELPVYFSRTGSGLGRR